MKTILTLLILAILVADPAAAQSRKKRPVSKSAAPRAKKVESLPTPPPNTPEAPAVKSETPAAGTTATKPARRKRESLSFLYGSFAWLWWQEPLELVGPTGTRYAMVTTANGPCFGAGWRKLLPSWEWGMHGCFFSAGNEVGATVTNVGYYQQGVESYGIIAGPNVLVRPREGRVGFGVQLPLFFRYAQWTLPPTPGYEVTNGTRITGGALFEGNWTGGRITLAQKIGVFYGTGTLWALQLNYRF
ncbi:MAG TPA: hypothetical protein VFV50_03195 [Bdellovibrionales bacterium]|nr:hypothetical protein [Bdellovibrionales bacterium]